MNVRGEDVISFFLIIPEADLLQDTKLYDVISKKDKMKLIEKLAIDMWSHGNVCCIQTGWEGSECSTSMKELIEGREPLIEPFAIVPRSLYREKWGCVKRDIEGNGAYIHNKEHWCYLQD